MNRDDLLGNATTLGGSVASCTAQAAYTSESIMLMVLSFAGVLATIAGLCYTIWNGNRNFQLAQRELELKRLEMLHENNRVFLETRAESA